MRSEGEDEVSADDLGGRLTTGRVHAAHAKVVHAHIANVGIQLVLGLGQLVAQVANGLVPQRQLSLVVVLCVWCWWWEAKGA